LTDIFLWRGYTYFIHTVWIVIVEFVISVNDKNIFTYSRISGHLERISSKFSTMRRWRQSSILTDAKDKVKLLLGYYHITILRISKSTNAILEILYLERLLWNTRFFIQDVQTKSILYMIYFVSRYQDDEGKLFYL